MTHTNSNHTLIPPACASVGAVPLPSQLPSRRDLSRDSLNSIPERIRTQRSWVDTGAYPFVSVVSDTSHRARNPVGFFLNPRSSDQLAGDVAKISQLIPPSRFETSNERSFLCRKLLAKNRSRLARN